MQMSTSVSHPESKDLRRQSRQWLPALGTEVRPAAAELFKLQTLAVVGMWFVCFIISRILIIIICLITTIIILIKQNMIISSVVIIIVVIISVIMITIIIIIVVVCVVGCSCWFAFKLIWLLTCVWFLVLCFGAVHCSGGSKSTFCCNHTRGWKGTVFQFWWLFVFGEFQSGSRKWFIAM